MSRLRPLGRAIARFWRWFAGRDVECRHGRIYDDCPDCWLDRQI